MSFRIDPAIPAAISSQVNETNEMIVTIVAYNKRQSISKNQLPVQIKNKDDETIVMIAPSNQGKNK